MDLERMQAEIRPRSEAEAVDMGFAMVREWARPVYTSWLAATIPVALLVAAALYRHPVAVWLVLWWLKPMMDRVPLHVMSRALFGSIPTWRQTIAELPRLWGRRLHEALIIQRLDSVRSFTMPVYQLEGLRGSARRARIQVLNRRGRGGASLMTFIMTCAEACFVFALISLAGWLVPARYFAERISAHFEAIILDGAGTDTLFVNWVFVGALILSMLIVEPLFVGAGFCLYLNRRTWLEAWDLELAFKKMQARLAQPAAARKAGTAVVVASMLILALGWTASPAFGLEPPQVAEPGQQEEVESDLGVDEPFLGGEEAELCGTEACEEARGRILEIVGDPVFGSMERVEVWTIRDTEEEAEQAADSIWLRAISEAIAATLQPLLWVALILCIVALVVLRSPAAWTGRPGTATDPDRPAVVFGLDLRRPSLPADPIGAARALLAEGNIAEAVSLLFRAALADLVSRDKVPIRGGMTEGECVRVVRKTVGPARAACFETLTGMWIAAAYGHREAPAEQLEAIFSEWPRHFRGPA